MAAGDLALLASGILAGLGLALLGWQAWRRHRLARSRLYWVLRPGARPEGPAELDRLRAMAADGRLDPEALVASVSAEQWRPLSSVLGDGR